jgi:hypothetical protein
MALQVDPIEVRLEARYREYEIQMLRILLADQLHLEDLRVRIPVGENKPRSNGAGPNDDRDMRFVKPDDSRSVGQSPEPGCSRTPVVFDSRAITSSLFSSLICRALCSGGEVLDYPARPSLSRRMPSWARARFRPE